LQDEVRALQEQLDVKNKAFEAQAKELADKALELSAAQAEKTANKAEINTLINQATENDTKFSEVTQENDLLLNQLMQIQEEFESYYLANKKLGEELAAKASELSAVQAATNAAQAATNAAKAETSKAAADAQAKLEAQAKEMASKVSELSAAQAAAAQAKQTSQAATAAAAASKAQLEALQAQTKVEIETLQKQASESTKKISEVTQENKLQLNQLLQVQEDLETYYLGQQQFEGLYQGLQSRWMRLAKRYPNYVDFISVDVVAFDHQAEVPSVTWVVKDYAQGGAAIDEFKFQTVMQDGQPGIGLVDKDNINANEGVLVPKLLKPQSNQLQRFVRMGQSNFRQLLAATSIIMQMERSDWRDVKLPPEFDLGFWRSSFKLLPTHLQALPILLRYDEVKLKRELINPDYEHLWLEFKELGLGARTWPKFELRLGAALVKPNGFSQFPKIEIPLIDGKIKPFESWYAESQDDNGAKLELRFSLEKNIFDTAVWSKLDAADKALIIRLIYILPDTLRRLETEQVAIHRPWATWVDFAQASAQIIENTRRAGTVKAAPTAPEVKAVVAPKSTSKKVAAPKNVAVAKNVVAPAPIAEQPKQVAPTAKSEPTKQAVSAAKAVSLKKPIPAPEAAPAKQVTPAAKALPPKKVAHSPKAALPKKPTPATKAAPSKQTAPAAKAAPSKKVAPSPQAALQKKPTPAPKAAPAKQVAPAAPAPLKKAVQSSKAVPTKKVAPPAKTVKSQKAVVPEKVTQVKKVDVASKTVTAKKTVAPAPKVAAKKSVVPSKAGKK